MAEYQNPAHYNDTAFTWDPAQQIFSGGIAETSPGYLPLLMQYREMVRAGTAKDYEAEQYRNWEAAARAIPTRDIASLTSGWQGDLQGTWTEGGWQAGNQDWWKYLDPLSPDVGPIVLNIRDKMEAGTASPQERQLYQGVMGMASDWDVRASVPQASDVGFGLGDNLTGALMVLSLGATGGLAAAPLAAGGASLATTLGSLGTLSGIAGTGAGVLGQALDLPALARAGTYLGALGGLAGGVGGLANLWGTGVQSLGDAARLAQSAGRITGALGTASGKDALRQASRYLGQAGQLGSFGAGVLPTSVTDWSGDQAPWTANLAPGISGVSNLLSAADVATQRGGGDMADFSYEDFIGWGDPNQGDPWNFPMPADTPGWEDFTGWGGDETQQPWYQGADLDTSGGGGGLLSTLAALGPAALKLLGGGGGAGGILGPLLSAAGGLGAGAIGSNASAEAARMQAAALNRGLDLQTAQWLQQQANQAPWLQAGQQALPQLQQLAARGAPAPFQPGGTIDPRAYGMPDATPLWSPQGYRGPQAVQAGDYRWTPGQGPRAADFRYTPGAVPTLQGAELLANDPGYQFRQDEARKALEASALARGTGMSGATLQALQSRSQDLASQEYGQAWNRASQQAQLREQWNQYATQQGWSQAQAEAAWREQMAQAASQQGFQQAASAQGQAWQQGLTAQQWEQQQRQLASDQLYSRVLDQNRWLYGQDLARNQTDYDRSLTAYNSQNAQQTTDWNRWSALAGLGQTAANQLGAGGQSAANQQTALLGQLGTAQAGGTTGGANAWQNALQNVNTGIQGYLGNQNYLQGLQSILSGLNR